MAEVISLHICDIFLGITLIISALKLSSIALHVVSLSNLHSRNFSISPIIGVMDTVIARVK